MSIQDRYIQPEQLAVKSADKEQATGGKGASLAAGLLVESLLPCYCLDLSLYQTSIL